KQAKNDAEAREAETTAVLEFVESHVFAAAGPEGEGGGLGRDVTLRKAVEAALPFLDKSFTNQPVIEARLRFTLGNCFRNLGDPKTAAVQLEASRALFTQQLGPYHHNTIVSMDSLANCYDDLGRYADALQIREETRAVR